MTELSPGLGLPYLRPSQAQKHVTHNQALQRLDQLVQLRLNSVDALTPPALPDPGDMHALGASPTGVWTGQGDQLASWDGTAWQFLSPHEGWLAWDLAAAKLRVWSATLTAWARLEPTQLAQLGVATSADAVNRLAVSAPETLLTHDGGGHQLKINKASDTETASLLFQSNWTGHAELGLAGDTAFVLKLSSDGTSWTEMLRADPATQRINWAASGTVQMSLSAGGLQLDVPLSGTAIQSDAADTTPGRLMRADYGYGPGNLLGEVSQLAGAPTGSVIERGSTATGDYIRWADGTQVCCIPDLNLSYAEAWACEADWSFPAGFASEPTVTTALRSALAALPAESEVLSPRVSSLGLTDATLRVARVNGMTNFSSSDVVTVTVTAIGRWF